MLQEFLNYDSAPQYHEMFVQDGIAKAISRFKENEGWKNGPVNVPKELLRVSLANTESDELVQYVKAFRQARVTLAVVYPYFPSGEDSRFKHEIANRLVKPLRRT